MQQAIHRQHKHLYRAANLPAHRIAAAPVFHTRFAQPKQHSRQQPHTQQNRQIGSGKPNAAGAAVVVIIRLVVINNHRAAVSVL